MSIQDTVLKFWEKTQTYATNGANLAAINEAFVTQLPGRADGPADAYRHLLISAEIARNDTSTVILNAHELQNFFFPYSVVRSGMPLRT